MIEVLRTNDPIRLDYAMVLLKGAGCYPFMADRFMASAEGSIAAVERRIMVPDEYAKTAREALKALDTPGPEVTEADWNTGGPDTGGDDT
ncbi:MAG: DUF2007 domain-containing protein [Sphingomonadales bacterium]|nr:MAG: DUF2007 domain-containing protein [Sphingomonadales bacterium]